MKPIVFVSHSSKDSARARILVDELEAGQELYTTFDVRDLRLGEAWRPQLYKWISRCHAGVLLITSNVMQHPSWVLQEATLLRSRAMLEGAGFRLFILIDDGVEKDDTWKTWFAPLDLQGLQRRRIAPDRKTKDISDEIRRQLTQPLTVGEDYFSRLAAQIGDRIGPFTALPAAHDELAKGFRIDDAEWQRIVGEDQAVDATMAQHLCQGDFGEFETISGLFNSLQGHGDAARRGDLLGTLRSYWVPLILSARLADAVLHAAPHAAGHGAPPNLVLLHADVSARADDVVEMVRDRQFGPYNRMGKLIHVPAGDETAPLLTETIAAALHGELFEPAKRGPLPWMVGEIDGLRRARRPQYVFVHIDAPAVLGPARQAASEFWPCVFIVSAPAGAYAEFARQLGWAEPELPAATRDTLWHLQDINRAIGYVDPKRRGPRQ